jgi:SOS response regulatory protein OraA/RecX
MINNAIKNIKVGDIIVKQIVAVLKLKFKNLELKDKNSINKMFLFFLRRGFSYDDISMAFKIYKSSLNVMN